MVTTKARTSIACIGLLILLTVLAYKLGRANGFMLAILGDIAVLVIFLRIREATKLHISKVELDTTAMSIVSEALTSDTGEIRLLTHCPTSKNRSAKATAARIIHSIQNREGEFIFLEVTCERSKDRILKVAGKSEDKHRILSCSSQRIPDAIAAISLSIARSTNKRPHVYMGWTEGHPTTEALSYVTSGRGHFAPLTRELLRRAESDESKRPIVHVG